MLTPDEVNGYAGLMAAPWDELSDRILRDMVRRIVKAGSITTTAQWQSYRAKALGVGASIDGTWIGNTMPKIWLSKNLRVYWTAQGNTWNGSSARWNQS